MLSFTSDINWAFMRYPENHLDKNHTQSPNHGIRRGVQSDRFSGDSKFGPEQTVRDQVEPISVSMGLFSKLNLISFQLYHQRHRKIIVISIQLPGLPFSMGALRPASSQCPVAK